MNSHPGTNNKPFIIKFDRDWCKAGEILRGDHDVDLKVIKVYRFNWWRRLLTKLGFKTKAFSCKVVKL